MYWLKSALVLHRSAYQCLVWRIGSIFHVRAPTRYEQAHQRVHTSVECFQQGTLSTPREVGPGGSLTGYDIEYDVRPGRAAGPLVRCRRRAMGTAARAAGLALEYAPVIDCFGNLALLDAVRRQHGLALPVGWIRWLGQRPSHH